MEDFVQPENLQVLEVSTEVVRKVGGINTVLRSKASYEVRKLKSNYTLVGPYHEQSAAAEFETKATPQSDQIIRAMKEKHGITVYYGRWLVSGSPQVYLLDTASSRERLGEWRYSLMRGFEPLNDEEVDGAVLFGFQVAFLVAEFLLLQPPSAKVVVHFHEWLAAVGLIEIKNRKLPVATVFTTHATIVGRYLCAARVDLYQSIERINADHEAGARGIYARHWIEKTAANKAECFSTVSEITGFEAEHILGRKPDAIFPNGLNVERFVALHEFQNLHMKNKLRINDFVRGHFYGYNDFDIDKTLYFVIAGRHEYYNKGVDMFIDALSRLNSMLNAENSEITIVAFIIMPAPNSSFNVESLKGQSIIRELKDTSRHIANKLAERLYETAVRGAIPDQFESFSTEDLVILKRHVQVLKSRQNFPPIVTHNMTDDNDEILAHLRRHRLFNNPKDRVKVVYHPEFLSSTSPLFPIEYNDFIRGCHLGVFPSYYEPWGYTPAECTAMGVPSVTSNLAGFAGFIKRMVPDHNDHGIYIVDRRYQTYQESVEQLANVLRNFTTKDRRERIEMRNKVERKSELFDWSVLCPLYFKARENAWKKLNLK